MRVYALAKSLDVESKVLLDLCRDLNYDVKNQLSSLDEEQCNVIKQRLKGAAPAASAPVEPAPVRPIPQTGNFDTRVRNLATPKPAPRRDATVRDSEPTPAPATPTPSASAESPVTTPATAAPTPAKAPATPVVPPVVSAVVPPAATPVAASAPVEPVASAPAKPVATPTPAATPAPVVPAAPVAPAPVAANPAAVVTPPVAVIPPVAKEAPAPVEAVAPKSAESKSAERVEPVVATPEVPAPKAVPASVPVAPVAAKPTTTAPVELPVVTPASGAVAAKPSVPASEPAKPKSASTGGMTTPAGRPGSMVAPRVDPVSAKPATSPVAASSSPVTSPVNPTTPAAPVTKPASPTTPAASVPTTTASNSSPASGSPAAPQRPMGNPAPMRDLSGRPRSLNSGPPRDLSRPNPTNRPAGGSPGSSNPPSDRPATSDRTPSSAARPGSLSNPPRSSTTPSGPSGGRPITGPATGGGNPASGGNAANSRGEAPRRPGDFGRRAPAPGPNMPRGAAGPGGQGGPGGQPGRESPRTPPASTGGAVKRTSLSNLSPEVLEKLRRGEAVNLDRPQPAPQRPAGGGGPSNAPAQPANAGGPVVISPRNPGAPPTTETEDEEGRKGGTPGKVGDREKRQIDRAKRASQRPKEDVVLQGGQVLVVENPNGSRIRSGGHRPKVKVRQPVTLPRKSGKIPITLPVTVRSLSEAIGMRAPEMLLKLRVLGLTTVTINSALDLDTAELMAAERGCELDIRKPQDAESEMLEDLKIEDDPSRVEPRSPVVTIMGHVDHGKTSLLDKIRRSNVVATEAGGITQMIRAWRVNHEGRWITFLDTPGHEAFTKMRARGANITDIAVIVVAATDGVMPQTEEAISHAKAAGVSMVVAINKVDMPNANIKKTEQQLYGLGVLPDNMGGDTPFVYTSATTGKGIDDLLEQILLVAELKELRANPHRQAAGVCLEAHLSGDEGVMATLLIQSGTLRRGEIILCGAAYGRVRAMYDDLGNLIKEAGPSTPVRITGLDDVPQADDAFNVVTELSKAREIAEKRKSRSQESSIAIREPMKLESLGQKKIVELKIILKAEARGSVEAIRKELEKLTHEEVRVRVLHAAIGGITESDVQLALTSPDDTLVVGFNVVPDDNAIRLAESRGISIREYNIIYNLRDDIKAALEGKLKPVEQVVHLGRAVVRATFKISKVGTVAGCYVTQGTIERSAKIRVIRDGTVVYPPADRSAGLESLKRVKDDAKEVREGAECGMKIAGYDDLKSGDIIEAYRVDIVQRTL
ncbi:translation initiation factor IF-2 [Tuwongella immobilis]|uniref:Translation initiation factor IF-2 n=1 Tax=Tuwongella immobilis TaxID=692036 RepID=A0A6C2YII7_9BACT|nr:translation initiation factor IF-2 [Tuwongella immobilis]VIP01226.1 translation initiation factor if-2 : Translation initiation factor IF-2 OS=Rhodopirellula sp. SWK7 GN=infB PE=3 SV=1: IF2_N: IF2_N: GTP_EFTU: GTP_EFTU_D2: IF-2: GTP_EFTU_D2 [Tuwongella immobilis]VTR97878.1 translation initiation factor if-2 : Translation initiation factor IF-2 OS=Rhodopirellula sp. SWK7 GN=infB PE=3 SV=1: IF2_N: IF2_N: GTP_EFTU: GTP_EFTU_D2: IF-2: GTP_EFTU_D2 [Tuwongella immobilis]